MALSAQARRRLVDAYAQLELWPDAAEALRAWKAAGLKLAPLANFAPGMIEELVAHAGLHGIFDALISTDRARTYQPDPRAYALGMTVLGCAKDEIAFAAFGGWDAAGAAWFGYPTFWMNRFGVAAEELGAVPDGAGRTLADLATFLREW